MSWLPTRPTGGRIVAERMTSVEVPGSGHPGWAEYGRVEPERMIEIIRAQAERDRECAQRILDAKPDEFVVKTYTGVHVQRDVKQLWPVVGRGSEG